MIGGLWWIPHSYDNVEVSDARCASRDMVDDRADDMTGRHKVLENGTAPDQENPSRIAM